MKEYLENYEEVLKAQNPEIEIWAVEPENAAILAGGNIGTHLQMGIGDGLIPENLNQNIYSDICIITDDEAIQTAKDLARREGLMCALRLFMAYLRTLGFTELYTQTWSGNERMIKLAKKLGKGKTVVTVLPDTAERYFSTPLFGGE